MDEMPICRALAFLAERDPDRPAVTDDRRTLTRAELEVRTNRLARAYADLGVGHDDLVTVALPNGVEFVEACGAIWKLGATPQPVSSRLPDRERQAIIDLADSPIVVGAEPGSHRDRPCLPVDFEPDPASSDAPLEERMASSWKAPTSGGSTGRPKLILAGQRAVTQPGACALFGVPEDGVTLSPGPLYHNAPFMCAFMSLWNGCHVVVMPRFDAAETLRKVEAHRANFMWVVPTMMSRIMRLDAAERERHDVSSLDRVWHGAAPCPPWVKEAWIDWLGPQGVWELYGGTEAQALTIIGGEEWLTHRGSVGRLVYGEVKVLDASRNEVPTGEVGELFFRTPAPEAATYRYVGAEPTQHEGFETIGDMGYVDEEGFVYLADRRTDMILAGGANIYPAEVEAALDEHPEVASCAVIGLPDDDLGQRVHAIVQRRGDVTDRDLSEFLAERLVRYKVPRSYEFVDVPLRDDAGKVRRSQLRVERAG